uniref:Peptidase S1 domain-containing protein n=1 Tax=Chelonoidis abingdonii TaxID=106734 RepID=A0A8C0JC19_CHEAB
MLVCVGMCVYLCVSQDIPRMLRGFQCQEHSHPWIVALFDGVRFRCTGTLIDRQWVVTAAQCNTGRTLNVRLGEHNLWHLDWSEQLIISSRVIPHPSYNRSTSQNNIMLVKLLMPAILNRNVKPLPLPRNCPTPDSTCVLSGWGSNLEPRRDFPQVGLANHPNRITPNMICAGVVHGGTDSCQGDPGSPLVCQGELQAVASWGFEGCSRPNQMGVFVKVCKYLTWLQDTMRSG